MNGLLDRLRSGEKAAVKELYEQYYHHCKWVVLNGGGSDDDAQDVFQQVVFSLWEKLERADFEIKSTLKGYLYNACKYIWWDIKKKDKGVSLDHIKEIADEDGIAAKTAEEKRYEQLYACIELLGGECKTLLERTYFENLSDKEIAPQFGLKVNYVRIKRKRCMDRVKKCIEQKQASNERI